MMMLEVHREMKERGNSRYIGQLAWQGEEMEWKQEETGFHTKVQTLPVIVIPCVCIYRLPIVPSQGLETWHGF